MVKERKVVRIVLILIVGTFLLVSGCDNPSGSSGNAPAGTTDDSSTGPTEGAVSVGIGTDVPSGPAVEIVGLPGEIDRGAGSAVALSASGFESYRWYINGDDSHPALSTATGSEVTVDIGELPLGPHTFTLIVSDSSGTHSVSQFVEVVE